ncbi:MAG: ABC transporter permease [Verrucomicrobia bacterium]|nr:ABC transporter permease [Verrucomicrobiota bacterium]MDA1088274.1 ABC transporter permease [Verrucomicrobiota bacterium]
MRKFLVMWQKELTGHFLSSTAYLTMCVFLAVTGWTFVWTLSKNEAPGDPLTVLIAISVTMWMPIVITVVTMGLFAEEKRSGTLESLLTVPVTEWQVVMAKYAGAMSFVVVMVAPTAGYLFILPAVGVQMPSLDLGSLLAGYSILALIVGFCTAMGLLISLLTRNQVVSAIACFCAVCIPFVMGGVSRAVPQPASDVLAYLAADEHLLAFARGMVDTRPIVLYVSGTMLALFLAVRVLESRRWT